MTSPIYQLIMRSGPTPEKAYELTQAVITIGRDYSNEIVINDPEVSRKHARLTAQTGGYIIEDMGSTNGTFVNGQRLLGPHLLRAGEVIAFGETISLTFETLYFDPNATVVAPVNLPPYQAPTPSAYTPGYNQPASGQAYPAQPAQAAPRQVYTPPPAAPAAQSAQPYYSGQIPQNPAEYAAEEEEQPRGSRAWIWLGVGCVVIFLCVCVGTAFAFDTLNLYCLPPFGSLFSWLYTCP